MSKCYLFILLLIGYWLPGAAQVRIVTNEATIPTTSAIGKDTTKQDVAAKLTANKDSLPSNQLRLSADTLSGDISYEAADSMVFDIKKKWVYMYGKADVQYTNLQLQAHEIAVDWNNKTLVAKGGKDSTGKPMDMPKFKNEDDFFESDEITYNFDTKQGVIHNALTEEGEGLLYSERVKKNANNEMYGFNSYYTTCHAEHSHFKILSKKVKVIPDKLIVSGPAHLEIEGLKTPLWLPFAIFPIKKGRRSGVILPAYGESGERGFFLRNGGYYFAINEHYDLLLQTDIYSRGSYALSAKSNYTKRYRYQGNIVASYSRSRFGDKLDTTKNGYRVVPDYFVRWSHAQDAKFKPGSRFSANVNIGSSNFHNVNSYLAQNYLANTFNSSISYNKRWAGRPFTLSTVLRHSQNSNTKIFEITLPDATFVVDRLEPFKRKNKIGAPTIFEKIGVSYTTVLKNTIVSPDSLLLRRDINTRMSNGMSHQVPIATSTRVAKYFTLSFGANYIENWYLQALEKSWNTDTFLVTNDTLFGRLERDTVRGFYSNRQFNSNFTLSTKIFGLVQFKNKKIKAIRHVITPQLGASFRPDFTNGFMNQSFYKRYRINASGDSATYSIYENNIFGGPPIGRQASLNYSIDNILDMKTQNTKDTITGEKKQKLIEGLTANGSYNFAADSFKLSIVAIRLRTTLFNKLNVQASTSLDPYVRTTTGRRLRTMQWQATQQLSKFDNLTVAMSTSLTSKSAKPSTNTANNNSVSNLANMAEAQYYQANSDMMIDFEVPYRLDFTYNFTWNKFRKTVSNPSGTINTLNINGDISLTPKWKVAFGTGYDFENKDFSFTTIDIYRDLHCWEMRLGLIPFGALRSFNFSVNVKASVLQDLKLTRRRDWYDYR